MSTDPCASNCTPTQRTAQTSAVAAETIQMSPTGDHRTSQKEKATQPLVPQQSAILSTYMYCWLHNESDVNVLRLCQKDKTRKLGL